MKLLVTGSRKKGYESIVNEELDKIKPQVIIEGCCKDSADSYAENWAKDNKIMLRHFPSTPGNYLNRNILMVKECDSVLAFWNGYSFGTAHTIATACMMCKTINVVKI